MNEETLNISYKKCSSIMVSHGTRGNDTVHLPGLRFVHVEVWPWSLKLLVEAGHYSHVVDLLGTEPLTTDTTYTNYNTKHWSAMEKKSLYVSITIKEHTFMLSLSMSSQKKTDFLKSVITLVSIRGSIFHNLACVFIPAVQQSSLSLRSPSSAEESELY